MAAVDAGGLINANPTVYAAGERSADEEEALRLRREREAALGEGEPEPVDALEVFELVRHINDPEHPLTLEQLNVAQLKHVAVDNDRSSVDITFTPTIPHCSMATLIGLCVRVKLLRALPPRFKVRVAVTPGAHAHEASVNKQLNDKERVAAALENSHLISVVERCIAGSTFTRDEDGANAAG
jgi:cytosolic iron-sulfur assembly component 2